MSSSERHDRVSRLFLAAWDLPPSARAAFLGRECGDDLELLREVEALLELDGDTSAVLPGFDTDDVRQAIADRFPDMNAAGSDAAASLDPAPVPDGKRFAFQGEVARGGMGAIFKIWDRELRRTLAMKMMLGGAKSVGDGAKPASPIRLRRFFEEAQITGQLDHPGVVPVHDSGVDAHGRMYFTMRLIEGQDLKQVFQLVKAGKDGWTQTRALGVMLKVCETVAYAHMKGVIHRDLKPANVMVGRFGETYVMDWGVAKVIGQKDLRDLRLCPTSTVTEVETERRDVLSVTPDSPLVTMDGLVIGTPCYMSPEQAQGRVEEVGPPADVYALGAMLYELLTGQMPYAPPSAKLSAKAILLSVAHGSPVPIHRLNPRVSPELIAICEKAMARESRDRYANTLEMADDLRAYLENRVVKAHRTGTLTELKKWMRRNRGLAVALGAVLVSLVAGAITSTRFAIKAKQNAAFAEKKAQAEEDQRRLAEVNLEEANRQRKLAEENARLADEQRQEAQKRAEETALVANFHTRLLRELSVDEFGHAMAVELRKEVVEGLKRADVSSEDAAATLSAFDRALTSANATNVAHVVLEKTIFERAVHTIETDYGEKPLIQAMLQTPLAEALRELGLFDVGEQAARHAVDARVAELGADHADTLRSINCLALLLVARGRYDEAEPMLRDVLTRRRDRLGDRAPETIESMGSMAIVLQERGRLHDAEVLLREALAACIDAFGNDHAETVRCMSNMANLLWEESKFAEAEPLFRSVVSARRANLGDEHRSTLMSIGDLAMLLQDQGKLGEAERLCRESLAGMRRRLGDSHPETLVSINNLAALLQEKREFDEAEALCREVLTARRAQLGDSHPETLSSINNLATVLHDQGKLTETEPLYQEALEGRRASLGDDHPATLRSMNNLATLMKDRGERREAEAIHREVLARRRANLGDRHVETLNSLDNLAVLLQEDGRLAEAEALFLEELAGRRAELGDDHPKTQRVVASLIKLYASWHQLEPGKGHNEQLKELHKLLKP